MVALRAAFGDPVAPPARHRPFVHVHGHRVRDRVGGLRAPVHRRRHRRVAARPVGARASAGRAGRSCGRCDGHLHLRHRAARGTREAWRATCDAAGVPLVVDSAAAFGARDEHRRLVGSDGATHVFSFHVTKPFAVGEGGLLVTGDAEVARRAESLVNFGIDGPERTSAVAGINAKMSELHAAGALAMLDASSPCSPAAGARSSTCARCSVPPVRFQPAPRARREVFQLLMPDARRRDAPCMPPSACASRRGRASIRRCIVTRPSRSIPSPVTCAGRPMSPRVR